MYAFFSDNAKEAEWVNKYSGEIVDTSVGVRDGGTKENCGIMVPMWGYWGDYLCNPSPVHPITCACEHPGEIYLEMRGLCPESNIDRLYVPRNKRKSGSVQLIGLDTSIIEYDKNNLAWTIYEHSHNTTATTDAPLPSYALGAQTWIIQNDALGCSSKGKTYSVTLKLTGCRAGEFTCSDGQCIRNCRDFHT